MTTERGEDSPNMICKYVLQTDNNRVFIPLLDKPKINYPVSVRS